MDLMELRSVYEQTVAQIDILEVRLREFLHRQKQMSLTGSTSEFDYIQFKISILEGVIRMYEKYRDQKWTQLQKESAVSLEEIIYGDVRSRSQPDCPVGQDTSNSEMEWSDEDFTIHMIPSVLTPIRDLEDFIQRPSARPEFQDMNMFASNLLDSSLTDFPMTREL